jgi:RNA polymerase sigma factor (sigma-70 family)
MITKEFNWSEALRKDREKALTQLYKQTFPMVLHYVKRNSGTEQDAKDLFQDALIIFYEKAVSGQLTLTASASTYLVSICRKRWLRELYQRSHWESTEGQELDLSQSPDDFELTEPASEPSLMKYVEQLGATCQNILLSFYYFRQTMEQIAEQHQYRNIRTATVQKFKCLERLRKSVSTALLETFQH